MARPRSATGGSPAGQEEQRQRIYSPRQPAAAAGGGEEPPPKPLWWEPFFAALAQTGNQTLSARAAKIDRSTPRKYLIQHPELREEFDAAVADALDAAVDNLEAVARQRSTIGWEEPVIHMGRQAWLLCAGSGLPAKADGAPTCCPYCRLELNSTKTGQLPEHAMLDDKGAPRPLTVKKFDNTLLMFLHNVSHRGVARRAQRGDDKHVDPVDIARQVHEALQGIDDVMDTPPSPES